MKAIETILILSVCIIAAIILYKKTIKTPTCTSCSDCPLASKCNSAKDKQ
ncbi:MAG: hypothetical protein ACFWUE_05590 [Xylanivirga thermophila]|jgi:hypothetical protein